MTRTPVPGALTNPGDFVFLGGSIIYVDTAAGSLMRAPMSDSAVGDSEVLDDTRDYRGRGLFLGTGPGASQPTDPPMAAFTATCTGLGCAFDAATSTDPDGAIAGYAWDFGDGATGSGRTVSHNFTTRGTYPVTLTVTDNLGATASADQTVVVEPLPNKAPTAAFTFSCTGLGWTFDAAASTDEDGAIADYAWDFGDGATGSGRTASHDYGSAGTYRVSLVVTDNGNDQGTKGRDVAVSAAQSPPVPPVPPAGSRPTTSPGAPGGPGQQPTTGPDSGGGVVKRPPGKVKKLKVRKTTRKSIKLTYRKAQRAEKYKFWAKPTKGKKKWQATGTTTRAKFTVKKLKPRTRYRIKVVAKNAAGSSAKAFIKAKTR